MAFKNVDERGALKGGSKMPVGEVVTGYVVGFEEGKYGTNIRMQGEDGSDILFLSAGNLKYKIKDGKIKAGLFTQITRLADVNIKGKMASQFQVLQDDERTIEVSETTTSVASPALSKAAQERADVKSRAASLKI